MQLTKDHSNKKLGLKHTRINEEVVKVALLKTIPIRN